ncbi:MAG TPA: C1 family peptidase [Candidatus Acidoferrales bacterium]|nr:C1 family peptidase [Candidatus Acidoferrales bacterium]
MATKSVTIDGRQLTLDARPDRVDLRDFPYRPPVGSLAPVCPEDAQVSDLLPRYLSAGLVLDQGAEGACTGFGLAAVINFLLWKRSDCQMKEDERVSPRMLYHLARFYDEWPGEDYEGSSCRGALKGWQRHGVCTEKLWPYRDEKGVRFIRPKKGWELDALARPLGVYYRVDRQSVVDMQAAIFHTGAIYVSASVHAGWEVKRYRGVVTHKTLPVIKPSKKVLGGHAFALVGYNDRGFVVQNSWGPDWGAAGFALLLYEDWVENGTDAWVVALGVPVAPGVRGQNAKRQTGSPQHFVRPILATTNIAGGGAWLGTAPDRLAGREQTWSEQEAYWHTIVTGNDGYVINRLPQVANEADNVAWVSHEQPLAYFKQRAKDRVWRLAVYAHGGLNSETDSIERIRILGPCFKDNGIYPVFTTWKSGWDETFANMLQDGVNEIFGGRPVPSRGVADTLVEASDRALEVFIRGLFGKSIWSEMKENVARSSDPNRGIDLMAEALAALKKDAGAKLEIHLIGHSAGSFVCGRLLSALARKRMEVASCTLYAPACDTDFALDHFKKAIEREQLARSALRIYVLSDELELDDNVGPYRKSLLYLVSRALERWHKTPLLGLASVFDASRASEEYWHKQSVESARAWQEFFWEGAAPRDFAATGKPAPPENLFVLSEKQVNVGRRRIKSSHGCFDNSITIISETLQRILRGNLLRKITNLDY